jgi:hypothetical protein
MTTQVSLRRGDSPSKRISGARNEWHKSRDSNINVAVHKSGVYLNQRADVQSSYRHNYMTGKCILPANARLMVRTASKS